jgi:menaquinone-dependent protoporphyrinogen oxidase
MAAAPRPTRIGSTPTEEYRMNVAVAVASKHGATREIAEAIARGLTERDLTATAQDVDQLASLDGVDAVVLGSAVYAGRWMKDARHAASGLAERLGERPLWLFSSGPTGEDAGQTDGFDPAELLNQTGARSHTLLAGAIDERQLGFVERKLIHAIHAPTGDFRDWDAVDAFAAEIAGQLAELPRPSGKIAPR